MQVQKLSTTDAFVLRDLADAGAIGVVRCAPKILTEGATWMARSVTYACASFGIQAGGASAGINAKPDDRAAALAAFDAEVAPMVADGSVALDPAKGVGPDDLPAVAAADPRPADTRAAAPSLLVAGLLAAAGAAIDGGADGGLGGRRVAIEGLDAMPPAVALALLQALTDAGAVVAGISTAAGSAGGDAGLDGAALVAAVGAGDLAPVLGDSPAAANRLFGAACDVLLVGSKAGALEHNGAGYVKAAAVVPWGPVAVTAKALAVLGKAGVVVVPDFLATAGPLLGWAAADPVGTDAEAAGARVAAVVREVRGHEHGAVLGACLRAESFLASWTDEKPFGRPLA